MANINNIEYNGIFILGYDLLQEILTENETPCDTAFDLCKKIYTDFLKSDYNIKIKSEYACLEKYVMDNYEKIKDLVKTF